MKILSLHCDYIKFKPLKKALKQIEELPETKKKLEEVKEPLVILTAIEKQDESNPNIITQLVSEIKDIAKQVNAKNIVLYPYAHLSSSLSSPDFALKTLEQADKELKKQKFKTTRAPFGYYKEFELKVKGHPLSELSREIINIKSKVVEEKYNYKQLLDEISKTKLDRRKLKENDHRILGQNMDLFSFSETAPGMVFWHDKGLTIRNLLIEFWREQHKKAGYQEISTPQILDKRLWQISGHWEKYRENIFLTEYEKRIFAVKPMNCPGGILVYRNSPKSYKDFPLRVAELGCVHRQELSGVLGGLFRVIQFTQDDAHIYCANEKQMEQEVINIMNLIDYFYNKIFKFSYHVELSTRPEKRIGTDSQWDKAEAILEKVLEKQNIKFKLNKGEGAFYGPKIDFHIKDSLGRTWQCATIQADFAMPERFDLNYTDEKNKKQKPIMIHRTVYGSLERFIGILLEHFKGHLPLWLAPVQVKVINFTDRNNKACERLFEELKAHNIRAEIDLRQIPLEGKIRDAELQKINYIIVIGDKEEKSNTLAVRKNGKVSSSSKNDFIKTIKKEIDEKD